MAHFDGGWFFWRTVLIFFIKDGFSGDGFKVILKDFIMDHFFYFINNLLSFTRTFFVLLMAN